MRQGHVFIRFISSIMSFYWNNEFCDSFSKANLKERPQRITIPSPHKNRKKSPGYHHYSIFLNLMKEAIIQGHMLSSPFWKGSLEGICLQYVLDQSNSILICWGRKKLPKVHQVWQLFSIPLHSLCFLRDLLEHIIVL